ncbi:MAG: hypothetical protein AB7P04_05115 [Bacteriovoracia bacterium]
MAASPIVLIALAELFLLPPYFFTFRMWEALVFHHRDGCEVGFFYPNQRQRMTEVGDLAAHTDGAVKKDVEWITDSHGYRNAEKDLSRVEVVLVGDSNVAGSSLTQKDTLASRLERELGRSVYAYAPGDMGPYFDFQAKHGMRPRVVVFEQMERYVEVLPELTSASYSARDCSVPLPWRMLYDRVRSPLVFNFLDSRLVPRFKRPPQPTRDGMYFLQGTGGLADPTDAVLETAVTRILAYRDRVETTGARFVFLPVPNKETVYWDFLGANAPRAFLPRLTRELQRRGIVVVDLQSAFLAARRDRPERHLYQLDDTHWNPEGVAIAAGLVTAQLRTKL